MGQRVLWAFRRDPPVKSDEQLIDLARHGDGNAFGELYRRHRKAAVATAYFLLRSRSEADDVVADAFAGVLAALRNGHGPRDNFRTYLLACVRNGCRSRRPGIWSFDGIDDGGDRTPSATFEDPERYVEADTVARAFASLNPRWQQALWLSEVEQRPIGELGEYFNLSPNATAALTRRARDAFATAYLAQHVSSAPNQVCARYSGHLAAYVRDQLTDAQRSEIERHLVECDHCAAAADQLRDMNASLRTLVPVTGTVTGIGTATEVALTGTSIGGMSSGLLGGGLLLKGVAVVLVVAPVLIAQLPVFDRDDGQPRAGAGVVSLAAGPEAAPATVAGEGGEPSGAPSHATSSTVQPGGLSATAVARPRLTPPTAADVGSLPLQVVTPLLQVEDLDSIALQPIIVQVDDLISELAEPLVGVVVRAAVSAFDAVADGRDAAVQAIVAAGVRAMDAAAAIDQQIETSTTSAASTATTPREVPPVPAPAVSVTPITAPVSSVPPVTLPVVSVPATTVPVISVPPMTVPVVSIAPTTVPAPSIPPVTVLDVVG
jgi:RNA polymerase sigma factor (sigma-70 family)